MLLEALDNPIWNSLVGQHRSFAIERGSARRYPGDVAPFVAVESRSPTWPDDLAQLVSHNEEVVLFGTIDEAGLRAFRPMKRIMVDQMVFDGGAGASGSAEDDREIVTLDQRNTSEMVQLTQTVFPGYFRENTVRMGRYYGIYSGEALVAMAGERMRPSPDLQELSGICTLPDFQGKGYAAKLTSRAIRGALNASRCPFLHVNADNTRAIKIYERLGFKTRITLPVLRLLRR